MVDRARLRAELDWRRRLTPDERLRAWIKPAGVAAILLFVTAVLVPSLFSGGGTERSRVSVVEGLISTVVTASLFLVFTLLAALRFRDWQGGRRAIEMFRSGQG